METVLQAGSRILQMVQEFPRTDRRNKGHGVGGGVEDGGTQTAVQEQLYLNGGPGESGQLFNVRSFLPDNGPHGLGWDEQIDNLLLRILEGQDKTDAIIPLWAASPDQWRGATWDSLLPGALQVGSWRDEPEQWPYY